MIDILYSIAKDKKAPVAARVSAAGMLLDRAYGKPAQFNTNSAENFKKAIDLSDDELAAIVTAGRGRVLELVANKDSARSTGSVGTGVGTDGKTSETST